MPAQFARIRERFHIERVALMGDRGLLTSARIREDLEPATLNWISALKSTDIRTPLKPPEKAQPAPLMPGELLPDAVAEIASPDFPGERLMVCLNPRLRDERRRKREALLKATEAALKEIARIVGQPRSKLPGPERPAGSLRRRRAERADELEGAEQLGRDGNLAPAFGAALQGLDPDRGSLEETPAFIGGEVLVATAVDELEIANQARHFA